MNYDGTESSNQKSYSSTSKSKTEVRYNMDINGVKLNVDKSVIGCDGGDVSSRDTFTIVSATKNVIMFKGEISKNTTFPLSIRLYGSHRGSSYNTTANVILRFDLAKLDNFNSINLPKE